jgi:hypothetical protein
MDTSVFDNYLTFFYKSLINLSEDFNINNYIKYIQDFKEYFGLNTTMRENQKYTPHFSETTYYKLILVSNYILNLKHIFLSTTNKTLDISYDLLISLLENRYYSDINYTISLLCKLAHKQKYINNELTIRLLGVARGLPNCNLTYSIIKRLNSYHLGNNKELIKLFKSFDNELSVINFNNKNQTSLSMIEDPDFRFSVKKELISDTLIQYFYTNFIQNIYDKTSLTYCDNYKDEYIKYLYIVKKTIDHIDQFGMKDHYLQRLFINIIMRSKSFLRCLFSKVKINYNYLYFTDKDVYIETYGVLGSFLERICNYDRSIFGNYRNIGLKLVEEIKRHISEELNKRLLNKSIEGFYFTDSALSESFLSYSSSFEVQSLNQNSLGLDLNIMASDIDDILNSITLLFNKLSCTRRLKRRKNIIYVDFEVNGTPSLRYSLILTINSPIIFRGNELFQIIKGNELFLDLFICLKYWAIQRGLFITQDHMFTDAVSSSFFDSTHLMYYLIYYLIKSKTIEQLKPNGFKDVYIILKKDNDNYFYESYKSYNFNINHQVEKRSDKTELAKLFINFFHFNNTLVNKVMGNLHQSVILDITSPKLVKSHNKENTIQITDFLVFSYQEKLDNEEFAENNIEISLNDKYQRKILNIIYRNEILFLEDESYRALSYILEESADKSNIRFAKLFLSKNYNIIK